METNEVKIGEHTYRIGKLDVFKQLKVALKLCPFLAAIFTAIKQSGGFNDIEPSDADARLEVVARIVGPLGDALGTMKEEDAQAIVKTCLGAVSRRQGPAYAPMMSKDGVSLMFEDLDLPTSISLCIAVVQENLSSFFLSLLPKSEGAGA